MDQLAWRGSSGVNGELEISGQRGSPSTRPTAVKQSSGHDEHGLRSLISPTSVATTPGERRVRVGSSMTGRARSTAVCPA
jgi:hypothetical protein